ncbi:unnamed protein product [Pseudo-nitzschia multistriata]|uniref:Uncharacterized protein n=1 Tax=Pseudo-nitzschia multistriata TaxID=183589 RepID=A0A448ZE03_9STRA|nr:unnamed protein product [Pseudo-nitzschia multistriata]
MPQGSEIAIENLKELFRCSKLKKNGLVSEAEIKPAFHAVYDEELKVEFNGEFMSFEWWVFQCNEMHKRNASWTRFSAEPLDSVSFDLQMELWEDGLDHPVHWHSIAWVNPRTSRIIRMRFLSGAMARYLFNFNKHNAIPVATSAEDDTSEPYCTDHKKSSTSRGVNRSSSIYQYEDDESGVFLPFRSIRSSIRRVSTTSSITIGSYNNSPRRQSTSSSSSKGKKERRRSKVSSLFNSLRLNTTRSMTSVRGR